MVLMMMALLMILVTAMLSMTNSELRSSAHYETGVRTEQLSEICRSVVVSQIRKSTEFNSAQGFSWASQPGAIRRYAPDGEFFSGHKLYSDSEMDLSGQGTEEKALATDRPPDDWNEKPLHYVDLNEPVVRGGPDGGLHTYFPIFDPRAAYDDPSTREIKENVAGFNFGGEVGGLTREGVPDEWRLPMPVEWIYVLADGTLGILNEENRFEPGDKVSPTNPIQGRIAFWTDDESCKININTASEPTYWALPSLGDREDWGWAKMQPGTGEFQRFPGHPATTAISPVLFPNQRFALPPTPDGRGKVSDAEIDAARKSAQEKGRIYGWAPKIQDIGSRSGTAFMHFTSKQVGSNWRNREKTFAYEQEYDYSEAERERLYASVDEFLLDVNRVEHDFSFTRFRGSKETGENTWVNEGKLNRSRAFLTAHSRAPETTLFGTPRIAMWPIHRNGHPDGGFRTQFDQLIARCSTLGDLAQGRSQEDNSYYFRREKHDSATHDLELSRNQDLLRYLQTLTSRPVPGYGKSLTEKYGEERDQILIEIFDYIRATNLFDPLLSAEAREDDGNYKTYTPGRRKIYRRGVEVGINFQHRFRDNHGFVRPSESKSWNARGLGRTVTLAEVALQFICCADGTPDRDNPFKHTPDPWKGGPTCKEYSAENQTDSEGNESDFADNERIVDVYSNFPPDPQGDPYKTIDEETGEIIRDENHPGYQRVNWNYCLEPNQPLPVGRKRIQGMLHFDFFNVAPGFTPLNQRVGIRVKGLSGLSVDGRSLYPSDEAEFWRVGESANAHWSVRSGLGGDIGKQVVARSPMPGDGQPVNGRGRPVGTRDPKLRYNELVTNFVDVDSDSMTIRASKPLEIEVLIQEQGQAAAEILQTVSVQFPDTEIVPSPRLIRSHGRGRLEYNEERDPPPPEAWPEGKWVAYKRRKKQARQYWSFYRDGFNNRARGVAGRGGRMGCLRDMKSDWVNGHDPNPGIRSNPGLQFDVVSSMIPWHGDFRLLTGLREINEDPNSPTGLTFVPSPGRPAFSADQPGESYFGSYGFEHRLTGNNNLNRQGVWAPNNPRVYNPWQLANLPWPARFHTNSQTPQFPKSEEAFNFSRRYGDFDIGSGALSGGAFINKPDEGNLLHSQGGTNHQGDLSDDARAFLRIPYFHGGYEEAGHGHFSPNRQISSPVMFGSLPTGLKAQDPWRTLLFRPDVNSVDERGGETIHPGAKTPPDHLFLDLFWMPVVEPWAISEPFSTAGKINLNYQILPFSYIRRTTGIHGLLKGERMPSLIVGGQGEGMGPRRDTNFETVMRIAAGGPRRHYLYRKIDIGSTLKDFDKKFGTDHTLFRSASQICEMHLVPQVVGLPNDALKQAEGRFRSRRFDNDIRMEDYWRGNRGTSDNLRERPYSNIYSRVTTQTNTWRIHYRVQGIKKGRETEHDTFDPEMDSVSSENRGSMLIERYIDSSDPGLPDFTKEEDSNLDSFYRFRVLSKRRFSM